MDLAAGSALAAATVIERALAASDFSQTAMDAYGTELAKSFVGADMRTYAHAPAFLEVERMYADYGPLLADVMYGLFNHDLTPRRHARQVATDALKASPIRKRDLAKDAWLGVRAL
jgi:electron transfer flavoprotein-quinone oxidoreductase